MGQIKLFQGDSHLLLKQLPDNSVDSIVTDPPYGLSFMGKSWDADVPSVSLWKECFRVLKPGGHLLSFFGTRTYHWGAVRIENAGFEIRDQIQWIYGSGFPKSTNVALRIDKEVGAVGNRGKRFNTAGQGISLNQNKELRSDHPDYQPPQYRTPEAIQWQGWGTSLKPANEPIVVARKPLEKGLTVAQNVLKWGTGALNVDGSRVGTEIIKTQGGDKFKGKVFGKYATCEESTHQVRWPANVILDEEAAKVCDEITGDNVSRFFLNVKHDTTSVCNHSLVTNVQKSLKIIQATLGLIAPLSAEVKLEEQLVQNVRSAANQCDSCATLIAQDIVKMTNLVSKKQELQAYLDSIADFKNYILIQNLAFIAEKWASTGTIPTTQSLSKLFGCALHATEENTNSESQNENSVPTRFLYCPKASKSERNAGLEGMEQKRHGTFDCTDSGSNKLGRNGKEPTAPQSNFHPTVKPLKLMSYLINLVTPPQGVVLDPFMGSGTTGVAAKSLGFDFVGIELDAEYYKIADKRINSKIKKKSQGAEPQS